MNFVQVLFSQARDLGLEFRLREHRLVIAPGWRCPPAFIAKVREHRNEIVQQLLEERDRSAVVHLARQIVEGEFQGADANTCNVIAEALRRSTNPLCSAAMRKLSIHKRL